MKNDLVLVAEIGPAHGIKGWVKLRCFLDNPPLLQTLGPLTDQFGVSHELQKLDPYNYTYRALFKNCPDRNAAELLRGKKLYAPSSALPAIADDEIYTHDLVDFTVLDCHGKLMGHYIGIHNFGAGDILEIKRPADSEKRTTLMLPMHFVARIDDEKREIHFAEFVMTNGDK